MAAKPGLLKVRLTEDESIDVGERAEKAGLSISAFVRSVLFPTSTAGVTTAAKLPAPKRKANTKLCRSCQKAGVAAWNCRECGPAAKGVAGG